MSPVAHVHHRDVGEPGVPERPDRLHHGVEVRAAGDALGDVLGPDELAGGGEARGGG